MVSRKRVLATTIRLTTVDMDSEKLVSPVPLSILLANRAENMVTGVR